MQNWLIFLALISNFAFPKIQTQSGVYFYDASVIYQFGEQVTFHVQIGSATQVQHLYLFIQPEGKNTRVETINANGQGEVIFNYDAKQFPLRPFAKTFYWFRAVLADGSDEESEHFSFYYTDNRFTWQSIGDNLFQVYWYEGDTRFGQDVLNSAESGLKSAKIYLPVDPSDPIQIYVYSLGDDLQKALQLTGQSWVAGHASPDIGVILVSVKPGQNQRMELERQIPHEITHLLQYKLVGDHYSRIPIWLLEGTASLAELYPNPDYERAIESAKNRQTLIPISLLCTSFPREASGAFLAYAEATSFVRYLHDRYGTSGIVSLFKTYGDGISCENGVQQAFNLPLQQIETSWRREVLNIDLGQVALQNLIPYLIIGLLILVSPLAMILITRTK